MGDGGSRQARQQEFTPTPPRDLFSADQHRYTDEVPVAQAAATQDPYLNGEDSQRRLTAMAEGDFRQQSGFPDREAPGGNAQAASWSEDAAASVAATIALQEQAQRRIDAGRHDTIGQAP